MTVERTFRQHVGAWRDELAGEVPSARHALRELLAGPLRLAPKGRTYRFDGELLLGRLLLGRVGLSNLCGAPGGTLTPSTTRRRSRPARAAAVRS
jgi:hypothetical protein